MSQMAASVESRGINLIHSLFFLKTTSSKERKTDSCESGGDAEGRITFVTWQRAELHP